MKKLIVFVYVCMALPVFAVEPQSSPSTTITAINSYLEFGGGDVYFTINNPTPECLNGYWLTKNDAGFNATLSMIIAAYQAGTTVVAYGLLDQNWAGTGSGKYCRLYALRYQKNT